MSIEILPNGSIVVRSPRRTPIYLIEEFVRSKLPWIEQRQHRNISNSAGIPTPQEPNQFLHRGELWAFSTDNNLTQPLTLPIPARSAANPLRAVERWQQQQATEVLGEMLRRNAVLLGLHALKYQGLKLRQMYRRWGSCASTGIITLNLALIKLPDELSECVVVHELAHLVHMNHSQRFYDQVVDMLPNYQKLDKELNRWTSVLYPTDETKSGAIGSAEVRVLTI